MAGTNITFNSNSLQTSTILTDDIDHHATPVIDAKLYPLAHANMSNIPYVDYPNKIIPITGTLIGTSIANLDGLIDTFKGYLVGIGKNLDIDYNGGTRRYVATVAKAPTIKRPGGLTFAKFGAEFTCTNPFGTDTSNTTALSAAGRTSGSYSDSYTFLGSAPYQRPVITITITALTGGTGASISYGNGNTGQQIVVTRTWAANDVLVIDTFNKTVTVNGFNVVFTGAFPWFAPGSQTLQYADSFATRTFTVSVVYLVSYL
jgi:hypothetical protein